MGFIHGFTQKAWGFGPIKITVNLTVLFVFMYDSFTLA
jgi:hypothetical protein